MLQRDLEDWDFGVGIHHISGREGAVIKAALVIELGGQAGVFDQFGGARGVVWRAGAGAGDL